MTATRLPGEHDCTPEGAITCDHPAHIAWRRGESYDDAVVPTIACEVCGAASGARCADSCTSDEATRYGVI